MPPTSEVPILCVTTDGMEQSKWALPRYKNLRAQKSLSGFKRPRIKMQGVWLHWHSLTMYVMDPDQPHDAASVVECIARSLEEMRVHCVAHNQPVPTEIVLMAACLIQSTACL